MGEEPVVERPECTICGYPMASIKPGERCPECGMVPAEHPLLRIPVSRAVALYVAAFAPVAVMGIVFAGVMNPLGQRGKPAAAWLEDLLAWLSWGTGLAAPIACMVVTVLLFRRIPLRRRHAPLLTVLPFSRMVVSTIIVGLVAAALAPIAWFGACLATATI